MASYTRHQIVIWRNVFALFLMASYCAADCDDLSADLIQLNEGYYDEYVIATINATYLSINKTDQGDKYLHLLKVAQNPNGTWEIMLHGNLDAETTVPLITFTFYCSDDQGSNLQKKKPIRIIDVNEFAPQFTKPDEVIHIPEAQAVDSVVYTIIVYDIDLNPATQFLYAIEDGASDKFEIKTKTKGNISLIKQLDFDRGDKEFFLNISATEAPDGKTNYTTLTILVDDDDDLPPTFSNTSYTLSVIEGDYSSEFFNTTPVLHAFDQDLQINQKISYRIGQASQSMYENLFNVSDHGLIEINGHISYGTMVIEVVAFQTDKPELRFCTTLVTVTVQDSNDYSPQMSETVYSANVSEAALLNAIVLVVSARDDDQGDNAVFKFVSNAPETFTVDEKTGFIRVNTSLDRETKKDYLFEVWAEETLTAEHHNSSKSKVHITVLDENDNSPQFNKSEYTFNISRTYKKGDLVGQVYATDLDEGVNQQLTYSFQFPDSHFNIDTNGNIKLTQDLSYKDIGSVSFIVNATDGASNLEQRRTSFVPVTVHIIQNNTSPPHFVKAPYTFNVFENAAKGFWVGQVNTTDDDGDVPQFIQLTPNNYVKLEPSGNIIIQNVPDLDSTTPVPSHLIFNISATDGSHMTETNVTINVLYVNEYPPKFNQHGSFNVLQNASEGTTIAQVNATDDDKGPDGILTYSLIATETSSLFKIEPATGEIKLNCSCLNYGDYYIFVKVTDGGKPQLQDITTVLLYVERTQFEGPHFSKTRYQVFLPEKSPPQILLQLTATNLDGPESELQFSCNGQTNTSLIVVFENGTVYINGSADAEKDSYFALKVSVSNGHGSDNAIVEVNITDVNDNDPVLIIQEPIFLLENTPIGNMVTKVSAQDNDITNTGFSYFFTAGIDGKFHIDVNTGEITLVEKLDRRKKSVYKITVSVSDHGVPPRFGNGTLILYVNDSDTTPLFTNSSYTFYVKENSASNYQLGSLYASDPDSGSSRQFYFKLKPGDSSDVFYLDSEGNLTLAKSLDYELRDKYILTAIVTDYSYEPKSSSATVTVIVINIVEPPLWPSPLPTLYITQSNLCLNEEQHLHTFSQEVPTVISPDNNTVEYRLLNMIEYFSINTTTGVLKIIKELDQDSILQAEACNSGSNICSQANLTIVRKEQDVLAFCPSFYRVSVNESDKVNTSFLDLNTTKPDATVVYNISTGNEDNKFGIGKHDGKLYIANKLDREEKLFYILSITAKDTSSQEEADAQVVIDVQDAPDNSPTFSSSLYQGYILESAALGSPIFIQNTNNPLILSATDRDEFYQLSYSIDKTSDTSNGTFNITDKAEILLAKSIVYENISASLNKTYTFKVKVTDGIYTTTTTVTVQILDANNNKPTFDKPGDESFNISEGQASILDVDKISIGAKDIDTVSRLEFSLVLVRPTGVPNYFEINATTGRLHLQQELDYEANDNYILNVTVTDGPFSIFKLVNITVVDINDNAPQFNQTFNMTVLEDQGGLHTNISVVAYDADKTILNSELTYQIVLGKYSNYFEFDKISKVKKEV